MLSKFSISKHIPNFITLLNLVSGCVSIIMVFEGKIIIASSLIFLAAVFDFLDGFSARLLKAFSPIGKELDSFADLISFGVAPAVLLFHLLIMSFTIKDAAFVISAASIYEILILSSPVLITVFSTIRLARYNVSTNQSDSFLGLPTPANALFIASLGIIISCPGNTLLFRIITFENPEVILSVLLNSYFIIGLIVVLSFLLIAPVRLLAIKFRSFSFKDNIYQYMIIIIAIILLVLLQIHAVPIIFICYIILSLLAGKSLNK